MDWIPLFWLAAALALLLFIEHWIHRHLQGVMLLLTGDREMTVVLYALPLLPGIVIHELSHALAALLLGVRVGRISISPRRAGQRIQLGFVPVERTDAVRASLIGLAPLLTGSAIILLIGYRVLGLGAVGTALAAGDWTGLIWGMRAATGAASFWFWVYLIFAISNTMLPSRADRQSWPPVLLFLLLSGVLIGVTGLGQQVIESAAGALTTALRWLALMCILAAAVDLPFVLLIALAETLLGQVKRVRIEY